MGGVLLTVSQLTGVDTWKWEGRGAIKGHSEKECGERQKHGWMEEQGCSWPARGYGNSKSIGP